MKGLEDLLRRIVERVPTVQGAILVAWDGEAVASYAPTVEAVEFAIVGAQWGVVWAQIRQSLDRSRIGPPIELFVDGERGNVLVHGVDADYSVVVTIATGGNLALAQRELAAAVEDLRREIG